MPLLLTKKYYKVKIILPTSTATKLFLKRLNDLKHQTDSYNYILLFYYHFFCEYTFPDGNRILFGLLI